MSYQIKRIDPYGITHPAVWVAAVVGVVLAALGLVAPNFPLMGGGLILAALAGFVATKGVISMVLGSLGMLGGIATFLVSPRPEMAGLTAVQRVLAAGFFAVLYTALMDWVVLLAAWLYNFFRSVLGLRGLRVDLEESEPEEEV